MRAGAMQELRVGDPGLLATDVGPIIDDEALQALEEHASRMARQGRPIAEAPLGADTEHGSFFAPRAYEIDAIAQLQREVFGPIPHIVRFDGDRIDDIVAAINGDRQSTRLNSSH